MTPQTPNDTTSAKWHHREEDIWMLKTSMNAKNKQIIKYLE